MTRALIVLALCSASIGCVTSEPEGSGSAGVVRGTVTYSGQVTGPLRVALFGSFPPRGKPLAEVVIDRPAVNQHYEVHGVPPGRSFVLAMIDADSDDGDRYHPTIDPGGAYGSYLAPKAVMVDPELGAAAVDIVLQEPDINSPYRH